ncbi:MAG: shikimate dehydrogenase [Croceibacterium sp.]
MSQITANGRIGSGRLLAGLAGRGILQSRTPWMHEQEAAAHGLAMAYELFDFTDRGWDDAALPRLLDETQREGFAGLNVTIPFKRAVIELLDDLSPAARAIGAVNTIAFRDGRRVGHNTDVSGFSASFAAGLSDVPRAVVLQLGCGGAGSATAHALLGMDVTSRLVLSDVDSARAAALHAQLVQAFGDRVCLTSDPERAATISDGIINATPIGMAKFPGMPIAAEAILPHHWVSDIIYVPLVTALLAEARRKGCRTLDGSGMAVNQAADAFAIFTGEKADRRRMRTSFAKFDQHPLRPSEGEDRKLA